MGSKKWRNRERDIKKALDGIKTESTPTKYVEVKRKSQAGIEYTSYRLITSGKIVLGMNRKARRDAIARMKYRTPMMLRPWYQKMKDQIKARVDLQQKRAHDRAVIRREKLALGN